MKIITNIVKQNGHSWCHSNSCLTCRFCLSWKYVVMIQVPIWKKSMYALGALLYVLISGYIDAMSPYGVH